MCELCNGTGLVPVDPRKDQLVACPCQQAILRTLKIKLNPCVPADALTSATLDEVIP